MRRFAALLLLFLSLGCGGEKEAARSVDESTLPLNQVSVARFIAGGGAADAALVCPDGLHRLSARPFKRPAWNALALYSSGEDYVQCLVAGPSGPVLAHLNTDKDTESNQFLALPNWPANASVSVAAFSPDGRYLAAAPGGPLPSESVVVWKFPLAHAVTLPKAGGGAVTHMAWSADGRSLMTADDSNRINVYRIPGKTPVYSEDINRGVEGPITAIDLSPDGSWVVVAANSIRVFAWKLPFMNTQLRAWGKVRAVFFAGSAESAVTIDETNSAIRWLINHGNVKTGATLDLGEGTGEIGVPAGGLRFHVLDASGNILSFDSKTLEPLSESPAAGCSGKIEGELPVEKL